MALEEGKEPREAAQLISRHRLHREQVMDALWPDLKPRSAANNLHQILHAARRAFEPSALANGSASWGYLLLRDEQLTLCPESPPWVEAEAFEEAAATASHVSVEPAPLRAAIDLYSGELLPEDRYEPWVEQRRTQLKELYFSLLLELGALYEERKEFEAAIEVLGRVVDEDATHEGAHAGLMRLHALLGKEGEHEPPILVAAPDQQPLPPDQRAERLTHREQEIALCVARGLTNRQIARELSISERTVENHIAKILKKQGFSSRTRIATWVAQR